MKIYSIHDTEFEKYGKVVESPYHALFSAEAAKLAVPEAGCAYQASVAGFETQEALAYYGKYFGEMPVQIGYCWGRNHILNALEWHKSSEINCALEDMILLLGDTYLMKEGRFDSSLVQAFLVKKGEAVELYQTTLHFCPCMPNEGVFKSVVILPKGTNTPLENPVKGELLVAKNKWLICHPDCKKQVDLGRVVGIDGINIEVK